MLKLVSETAEIALDLLEKNGALVVPFCKAYTLTGEPFTFMWNVHEGEGEILPEETEKGVASIWSELRRRIDSGTIREFAFCADVEVKFANETQPLRRLKIEFQDGSAASGVYYFPLTVQGGHAEIGPYALANVPVKLL